MRMSAVVLACFLAVLLVGEAFAALRIKHFPPCPEAAVVDKTCECRAFVSTRLHVCHPGQHCLRNAFHGMCW
jgi:hypothetical protein